MFPNNYFAPTYFPSTYFPPVLLVVAKREGGGAARFVRYQGPPDQIAIDQVLRDDEEVIAVILAALTVGIIR